MGAIYFKGIVVKLLHTSMNGCPHLQLNGYHYEFLGTFKCCLEYFSVYLDSFSFQCLGHCSSSLFPTIKSLEEVRDKESYLCSLPVS